MPLKAQKTPFHQPPAWAKEVIWYQIFVERFNNGDPNNDPKPPYINTPAIGMNAPENWTITPWNQDWYQQENWAISKDKSFNFQLQHRRYGGDLQGVINKIPYLKNLGITAVYLNPINDAPSLHKYDARNYHHVDINFGPDPEGDIRIIASENPNDPKTWKWTSADRLFLDLVNQLHQNGIKVIMDYSWNHTGTMFWAWQDILKNQAQSAYKDWYEITSFNDPETPENEFTYKGWLNIASLPEIKKVNITTPRKIGHPYEGDIHPGMKAHIFAVTQRWLAPDGDTSKGIDGFRLDVADHVGMQFWRDYRKFVRKIQPNAYLVGEIWWEEWPDKLMNPAPYTQGDVFDAVMFYQMYRPARYFFADTDFEIDAKQFKDSLLFQFERLKKPQLYAMMNVASSHDTPRLLTDFGNPNKYKYHANPSDDSQYITGKPSEEAYKRLQLYLAFAFTTVGAPHIWNGEELGMWGGDDPDCRKPLWWDGINFMPENRMNFQKNPPVYDKVGFNEQQFFYYQILAKIRNENPVLHKGKMTFFHAEGKHLGYIRHDKKEEILMLFNVEKEDFTFSLPKKGKYQNLFTQQITNGKEVTLPSMQFLILKKMQK